MKIMEEYSFANLLGHSMLSAEILSFIEKHGISKELRIERNAGGYIYQAQSWKEGDEISISCIGNKMYSHNYGTAIHLMDEGSDELIVSQINVDNNFSKTRRKSPIQLPFFLELGDDKEVIYRKLKKKPFDKTATSYGHACWFKFESFKILTALNETHELIWLRVTKLTKYEIEKEILKKNLRRQNKNIRLENIDAVAIFADKLPTNKWKQRMLDGDERFTENGIAMLEQVLIDYLNQLKYLISKNKMQQLFTIQ